MSGKKFCVILGLLFMMTSVVFESTVSAQSSENYQLEIIFNHEDYVEVSCYENIGDSYEIIFVSSNVPFNSSIDMDDLTWYMYHYSHLVCPVSHATPTVFRYYPVYTGLSYVLVVVRNGTCIIDHQSEFMIRSDTVIASTTLLKIDSSHNYIGTPSRVSIPEESNIEGTVYRIDLILDGRVYSHYEIEPLNRQDILVKFNTFDLEEQEYTCSIKVYSISASGDIHTMNSEPFTIRIFFERTYLLYLGLFFIMIGVCCILYLSINIRRATIYGVKHGIRERMN
jgi:hypothetical protein